MTHQPVNPGLIVTVKSLKKTYFDGPATYFTSLNDKGEFDILPGHANFISLIKNYFCIDKGLKSEKKFLVGNGILRNKENKVEVFLEV